MKLIRHSIVYPISALLLGLLLVIWPESALKYLVMSIGLLFIIPGIISLVFAIIHNIQKPEERKKRPIVSIGSILFGLSIISIPTFYITILMYLLGGLLILGGIQQIVNLIEAKALYHVSWGYYIVPTILLILGLIFVTRPSNTAAEILSLFGTAFIIYGIIGVLNYIRFRPKKDRFKMTETPQDTEFVEIEETEK